MSEPRLEHVNEVGCVVTAIGCARCGYVLQGLNAEGKCPRCGRPVAQTLRQAPTHDHEDVVVVNLPCNWCGHNLRGLRAGDHCPECDEAVPGPNQLKNAAPWWRRLLPGSNRKSKR